MQKTGRGGREVAAEQRSAKSALTGAAPNQTPSRPANSPANAQTASLQTSKRPPIPAFAYTVVEPINRGGVERKSHNSSDPNRIPEPLVETAVTSQHNVPGCKIEGFRRALW